MPNVEKLSIALTAEMAAMVRQAVESGEYASASEVIRDALRLWRDRELARARARRVARGLAQGNRERADAGRA